MNIVVSKKDTFSLDRFAVNLIVSWKLFISRRKVFRLSSLCVQITKMSSMNLHHMAGLFDVCCKRFSSSSPINMFA